MSGAPVNLLCLSRVLLCCVCIFPLYAAAESSPHTERQQSEVLFLSLSDPDSPDITALIEVAESEILADRTVPVHFTVDYVEPSLLNSGQARKRETLTFLQDKHQRQTFDLVVAIGDQAAVLSEEDLARWFRDTPLVFYVVTSSNMARWLVAKPHRTGVIRKLNYIPTLDLALQENSGTREVIVISGSSASERLETQTARDEFRSYEPNVTFKYWTDLTLADLKSRLATLAFGSIILLLDFSLDANGEQFVPSRILPTIASVTNRPIYGTFASFIGKGVVGGSVADLREVGHILGQDGARILDGRKPETIPVQVGEFQRDIFDWRQLHRLGIRDEQLPVGSSVLYWQASPWELYRWKLIALSAAVVVETMLIFLLLQNRVIRKRAEKALQRKQAELSDAQRVAQVGSWQWDPQTDALTCSDEFCRRLAVDPKLRITIFNQLSGFFTPESWNRLLQKNQETLHTGESYELEAKAIHAQGATVFVVVRGEAVHDANGYISQVRGTLQDITERKQIEDRLRESENRFRLMADSAPVLMCISDSAKHNADFNKEWLTFTGRTMQQELKDGWLKGIHPDDLRAYLQGYNHAFDARQSFTVEYRLRRHDGRYRWMLSRSVPRFLPDGEFVGYISCSIDITEQKETKVVQAELSGRLMQAQEEERARIARELHDDINQRLALLANGIQELEQTTKPGRPAAEAEQLHTFWQLTSEIAGDIQNLSHRLHPSKLHYLGLSAALRSLCQEFSKLHKIEVECVIRDLPTDLDESISLSLFRTAQEALRNIAKHSQARHVKIELLLQQALLTLRLSDDGVGFDYDHAKQGPGLGLASMQERLRLVGGRLSVWSRPSLGSQVEATVPIRVHLEKVA